MPGGLAQIAAALSPPALDLVGNPQFTNFSFVYKRPTNFSTEFVAVPFDGSTRLDYGAPNTLVVSTLPRQGDLLLNAYLSFELPDIYADDASRFQWIDKVACYLVREVRVKVGGQIIERMPGEWIDVQSELTTPADKRVLWDRLTGNVPALTSPTAPNNTVEVQNNELSYSPYPVGDRAARKPSIRGRRVYLPLPLWFSKTPGHALPLIALQGAPVEIDVDVRPWSELYVLWDAFSRRFYAPQLYPAGQATADGMYANTTTPGIGAFLETPQTGTVSIDLRAQLECEFGFLDAAERTSLALTPRTMLIETVTPVRMTGLSGTCTQELLVSEPTRELVWMFRRVDALLNNEFTNLTASVPADEGCPAMLTATLLLNGAMRMEPKPAAFFDTLQPLQHHSGASRPGIHAWSFALSPERPTPSGFIDLTSFERVALQVALAPTTGARATLAGAGAQYQLDLFAVTHNFLTTMNGVGGKKYV